MGNSLALEWWPEELLRRHPLRRVFVCDLTVHPPPMSHVVNFPRVEIPLRGSYENQLEIEGRILTLRLRPGMALYIAPNCWNLPVWRPNAQVMSLLFGKKQIGISIVTVRGSHSQKLSAQKFSMPWPLAGPLPCILEAMLESKATGSSTEILTLLIKVLIRSVRELLDHPIRTASNRAQGLLDLVCFYLQNHYQYNISRDSVAKEFGVTPNHLSRLFNTHGHMTFVNYLSHVRIDRAKHLLRNYNFTLDDIAVRCGYRDTPYFSRVFKRITKTTPAQYRQRARHLKMKPAK